MTWLDRELTPEQVGDLSLLEAAAQAPMSSLKQRPGESLRAYGKRLKADDARLARQQAAKKKSSAKTRSGGSAAAAAFEKLHPRGRGGQWIVKQGQSGAAVKAVQSKVGAKVDGQYGGQTKQAVMRFQRQHGLQVDGVVGAQTIAAMRGKRGASKVKPGTMTGADRAWLLKQIVSKGKGVKEAAFEERLHPRGRGGKWIPKVGDLVRHGSLGRVEVTKVHAGNVGGDRLVSVKGKAGPRVVRASELRPSQASASGAPAEKFRPGDEVQVTDEQGRPSGWVHRVEDVTHDGRVIVRDHQGGQRTYPAENLKRPSIQNASSLTAEQMIANYRKMHGRDPSAAQIAKLRKSAKRR